MSNLFFDLMDAYYPDSDWSNLPGADKSSCLEDDYSEESDAEVDEDAIDNSPNENLYYNYGEGGQKRTRAVKNYSWLKPPSDWK